MKHHVIIVGQITNSITSMTQTRRLFAVFAVVGLSRIELHMPLTQNGC